jgi:hypothetical protein
MCRQAVQLQAWNGPEDSRKLKFPDFMTTAQDGGKIKICNKYSSKFYQHNKYLSNI